MTFFFDLGCPFSYLAAERVERLFGRALWIPAPSAVLRPIEACDDHGSPLEGPGGRTVARARAQAEIRASELRLPLVWPERYPLAVPRALRAAAYAGDQGAGAQFALAAARLAFCGGFDLEDPEILAEAAAAAGVGLDECLAAAADESYDTTLWATAERLVVHGVPELPAIRVADRWFGGERALAGALAALAAG